MKSILYSVIILLLSLQEVTVAQIADSSSVGQSMAEQTWNEVQKPDEISFMGALAKGVGALLLILSLIYGLVWTIRFFMTKKSFGNPTSDQIRVLSTTYLAPKKSVALLQVYDKAILIGVSEDSMTTLTELDEDGEWNQLIHSDQSQSGADSTFSQKLTKALKQSISKGIVNKKESS